jgi:hypothetical protein
MIGLVTTAFAKFDGVDRDRLPGAFLVWETKTASGSCRRCAPTASITRLVFTRLALTEQGYQATSMFHLGRRPEGKRGSIQDRSRVCQSRRRHARGITIWSSDPTLAASATK